MYIIKTEKEKNGMHLIQSQSHRTECWLDGYIEVPKELEDAAAMCEGFCDLTIENGVLVGITARPDLKPAEAEKGITTEERLEALEKAVLEMALGGE